MTAAEYLEQGEGEWIQITCGACGRPSGFQRWIRTEVFGDLPPGEFQCPRCMRAFRRERHRGEAYRLIDGEWVYRPLNLVPIASRL